MSAAWDCSDLYLQRMLLYMTGSFGGESPLTVALFQNDYVPVPGADIGDFVEADFPGYMQGAVGGTTWGDVTVTDHVAEVQSSDVQTFTGASGTWSPQTIYGYYVLNWDLDFFWAERFPVPIDMTPEGQIRLTPRLKHANLPA